MKVLRFILAFIVIVPIVVFLDGIAWTAWTAVPSASNGMVAFWTIIAVPVTLGAFVLIARLFVAAVRGTPRRELQERGLDTRPCPFCLSDIPQQASVCRYCQREVPPPYSMPAPR